MAYNDILIFLRSQKYVPSYIYWYTTRLEQKFKTLTPAPTGHLASSSVMKKVPLNQSYKLLAKHSKINTWYECSFRLCQQLHQGKIFRRD